MVLLFLLASHLEALNALIIVNKFLTDLNLPISRLLSKFGMIF